MSKIEGEQGKVGHKKAMKRGRNIAGAVKEGKSY